MQIEEFTPAESTAVELGFIDRAAPLGCIIDCDSGVPRRIINVVSGQLADIVTDDHTIEENGGLLWNLRIASVQHAEPLRLR